MKIRYADLETKIRQIGASDFAAGRNACPFAADSIAAQHWREGWEMASRGEVAQEEGDQPALDFTKEAA